MTTLLYILLCLIWGSTWIMIRIGLENSPPLTAAAARFAVAILIFLVLTALRGSRYPATWRGKLERAYPGIYMYGLGYVLVYLAERYISSSLTAVLFASFPLFVAVLAAAMFKEERNTPLVWLGLLLGLGGIVVISIDSLNLSGDLFLGTVLALGGSFSSAYGMMLHKRKFASADIYVSVTLQMALGGILLIASALLIEDVTLFQINVRSLTSVIYLAAFGSVVAFLGYYWLIGRITAVSVSLIAFITPLVAILIGVGLAGESLTFPTICGTGLILGGVFLVIRR